MLPGSVHCVVDAGPNTTEISQFQPNFHIGGTPVPIPLYRSGPYLAQDSRPSPPTCQISFEFIHCVTFQEWKPRFLDVPSSLHGWGPNLVCYSSPIVYAFMPNLITIGLFCHTWVADSPKFCRFLDLPFWLHTENAGHRCTTTNLSLSNSIKIISVLHRLHGKIVCTNSVVQKHDRDTKRQTKNSTFLVAVAGEIQALLNSAWW